MILALRTDKPDAELYLYDDEKRVDSITWLAHRQLSDTLLSQIETLLTKNKLSLPDLTGIIVYLGPGSFTGLRIGITVANTLAYSLNIPNAGAEGEDWIEPALAKLKTTADASTLMPEYGSEAHITLPRK